MNNLVSYVFTIAIALIAGMVLLRVVIAVAPPEIKSWLASCL